MGHPCIELAGAMVHLSWPPRAHMSGGGYLSGGVAAGPPLAVSTRLAPVASTRLALAACKASDRFPPYFPPVRPLPLLSVPAAWLSPASRLPAPACEPSSRICARNLVLSLSLKHHVDFLGARGEKVSFSKERRREAVFSFALTARHFSPRSRTLGCVVFLLAPRAPMCKRSSQ